LYDMNIIENCLPSLPGVVVVVPSST
jgi:hypothetical protein